jgi:hypothetical protein
VRAHLPSFAVTNRIRQRSFDSSITISHIIPQSIRACDKVAKYVLIHILDREMLIMAGSMSNNAKYNEAGLK